MSCVRTEVIPRHTKCPWIEPLPRRPGARWGAAAAAGLLGLLLGTFVPDAGATKCPNLTILLDQSASMAQDPAGVQVAQGSPSSKWAIATAALTKLDNRFDGLLPIGYSNFPAMNNACVSQGLRIQVGYGNRTAINNAMIDYPYSGGSTPICDAMKKLAAEPALNDATRGQYVLLVTDGAPAMACCGADPVQATVDAITAAAQQSPPIYTFVVGFGQVAANEQAALDKMAIAGGHPASTTTGHRYYQAETPTSLDTALSQILIQINNGDAGPQITCEDGCYGATPCPSGQVCLANACKPDPCAGKTCGLGQSCQADGTCAAVCSLTCPSGTACHRGQCVTDACSGTCSGGQTCDQSTSQCVTDPKCVGVVCHNTQGCIAGVCQDNPCTRITCPEGYQCRDFDGSCQKPGDPGAITTANGCEITSAPQRASASAALASGMLLLLALALRRRRARRLAS